MADFIGAIGLMTIVYAFMELLTTFTRNDTKDSRSLVSIILAPLLYLLMFCTAPIGLLVMLHDKRMEKIHRAVFLEERKPLEEINVRKEKRMEEENRILTTRLKDANNRPAINDMLSDARRKGYKEGYRDGQQDHAAGINLLDEFED